FQVFTGPNTLFNGNRPARYPGSISDGTSNTVLIVTAAKAVPWTAPQDLPYSEQVSPKNQLGYPFAEQAIVSMADGSVRMVSKKVSEKALRYAIMPGDGNPLGDDW